MALKSFFLDEPANLLAAVVALGLIVGGVVALTREQGVATVFLMLAGFVVLMFLEYRHVHHDQ